MDIKVKLVENGAALHGPEVSTNLPTGIAVVYGVKLASAIKNAVVDATKSKDIKNAILKAKWTFAKPVTDDMAKEGVDGIFGVHSLALEVDGKTLSKKVRCHVTGEPKPKITFSNGTVKGLCDKDVLTKLVSIWKTGPSETGHGPVEYLDGALHAHVTNTEGVAWKWRGDTVHVVAVGKKNNQMKTKQRGGTGKQLKTAEYDWTE